MSVIVKEQCHRGGYTIGNFGDGLMEVLSFFSRLGAYALPGCVGGRGQGRGRLRMPNG